jgi:hypothetical protein
VPNFTIETQGILKGFDPADIKVFVYDLFLVFHLRKQLDQDYGNADNPMTKRDIETFKKLLMAWEQKYKDIIIKLEMTGLEFKLSVFLLQERVEDFIPILQKITNYSSSQMIREHDVLMLDAIFTENGVENSLTIKQVKQGMKLIYLEEDMLNPKSPEFHLCTYYGMKGGYNKSINLQLFHDKFSFGMDRTTSTEGDWFNRFPRVIFR